MWQFLTSCSCKTVLSVILLYFTWCWEGDIFRQFPFRIETVIFMNIFVTEINVSDMISPWVAHKGCTTSYFKLSGMVSGVGILFGSFILPWNWYFPSITANRQFFDSFWPHLAEKLYWIYFYFIIHGDWRGTFFDNFFLVLKLSYLSTYLRQVMVSDIFLPLASN